MTQSTTALRLDRDMMHDENTSEVNEVAQRRKYGGLNFGAAFFGWLVATGMAAIITSIIVGTGAAVAFTAVKSTSTSGVAHNAGTIGLVSGILLLIALAISYLGGGYVAGRMSRFNGARQGMGVWIFGIVATLLLGIIGAIFGSKYNALQQINLPHIPINQGKFTTTGLIALIVTVAVTLLAAVTGGKMGEQYHRKVDQAGIS